MSKFFCTGKLRFLFLAYFFNWSMIYCLWLKRFFSCLFSEDVLKLLCQRCQTFIRSEHHIYRFILASLIKGLKRAFAQTVLSLEAENRFPSSWNLKNQRVPFGHLRIRTDANSKRYQYITIQISLKEVIKLIRLLCHLFCNGLALSIKKKKKVLLFFSNYHVKRYIQFFMFIYCQLNGSKKSALQRDHYSFAGKTYGNRKLQRRERERS